MEASWRNYHSLLRALPLLSTCSMAKRIIIQEGQSFFDFALQAYGNW